MIPKLKLVVIILLTLPAVAWPQDTLSWSQVRERVLENSPALEQIRWDIRDVEMQQQMHFGAYLPSLNMSAGMSRYQQGPREVFLGGQPFIQTGTAYNSYSTGASLSYQLFDWGNRNRETRAYNQELNSREASLDNQKQQILTNAFTLYCQLLEARENMELLMQQFVDQSKQETLINRLVESGLRPSVDALQMQVQMRNMRRQVNNARSLLEQYNGELALLMGQSPASKFTPVSLNMDVADSITIRNKEEQIMPASFPTIQQLESQIAASRTREQIQRWNMMPSLGMNTSYSRGDRQAEQVFGNWEQNWNASVRFSISIPVFQQNNQRLQLQRQKIQTQRLQEQLQEEKRRISQELNRLHIQYNRQANDFRIYQSNQESLRKIYEFKRQQYESGTIDYQEMSSAFQSLISGEQSLITAKYDLLVTYFTLMMELGDEPGF